MVQVKPVNGSFRCSKLQNSPSATSPANAYIDVLVNPSFTRFDDPYKVFVDRTYQPFPPPFPSSTYTGILIPYTRTYSITFSMTPQQVYAASAVTLGSTTVTFLNSIIDLSITIDRGGVIINPLSPPTIYEPIGSVQKISKATVFGCKTGTVSINFPVGDFFNNGAVSAQLNLFAGDFVYFTGFLQLFQPPSGSTYVTSTITPEVSVTILEISDI